MRRITFSVCMTVAAGGALVVSSSAMGQDCYRIVDIVELGFIPSPFNFTFGLNDQHEVVGTYEVGDDKHAFLWLPEAAYDLSVGFHDLHTLAGLGTSDESAAFEINDAGMAVGWIKVSGDQVAVVWEIDDYDSASPPLTYIDLSDYTAPDDGAPDIDVPTVAWAISDDTPPVVIGDASGESDCDCPPDDELIDTVLGFTAVLDGTDVLEELLPILSSPCDFLSHGRDINSLASPLTVGYSDGGSPCAPDGSSCLVTRDASTLFCGRPTRCSGGPQ